MNRHRTLIISLLALSLFVLLSFTGCNPAFLSGPACGEPAVRAVGPEQTQVWRNGARQPNDPVLSRSFKAGTRMRWYWGGCTTLLGVIDDGATKELIMIDGYVSKDASGLVDFTSSSAGIARVRMFADYLKNTYLRNGFIIRGILTTHSHADHVGDIGLLLYYLKQDPHYQPFPIIADYATRQTACEPNNLDHFFSSAELARIRPLKELITDLVVYKTEAGQPPAGMVTACLGNGLGVVDRMNYEALISPHGRQFSREYCIYNIAARAYTAQNAIALGGFRATAFLMDHASVPLVSGSYRVNAYQVWDAAYPEGSRALLLDTTDQDNFVQGTIRTDHLFLTWAPEFFQSFDDYLLGYNKIRTATTVMNHVRFYDTYSILHYILPMHVDDIMALSYTTADVAEARLCARKVIPYWYYKLTGFLKWTKIYLYEAENHFSLPVFMMSEARLASRLPANGEYRQSWDSGHIDFLIPDAAPWNASPAQYSTTRQSNVKIAFALFGWRLGDSATE